MMNESRFQTLKNIDLSNTTQLTLIKQIREMLPVRCGMHDINELCSIYHQVLEMDPNHGYLADICADAIRIKMMQSNPSINPKLHQKFLEVPDTYYDFINGMEEILQYKPRFQYRLLTFLERHPDAESSDIIEFMSILTEDASATDAGIDRAIELYREQTISPLEYMMFMEHRNIPSFLNHQWVISTLMIGEKEYTFRLHSSACFVDYNNRCIGSSCMNRFDSETLGLIYLTIHKPDLFPGVAEALLTHMEEIARELGAKKFRAYLNDQSEFSFFQTKGYSMETVCEVENPTRFYMLKYL